MQCKCKFGKSRANKLSSAEQLGVFVTCINGIYDVGNNNNNKTNTLYFISYTLALTAWTFSFKTIF